MTPLPRGRCSVCGKDVAVRKGGLAREHVPEDRGFASFASRMCRGSGLEVNRDHRQGTA